MSLSGNFCAFCAFLSDVPVVSICVFASGEGTNFRAICASFKDRQGPRVTLLVCNNPRAKVVGIAKQYRVTHHLITNEDLAKKPEMLISRLKRAGVEWIVLAGFVRLLPVALVEAFRGRILNVHPALLRRHHGRYGGKGMYGIRVHKRVVDAKEAKSGITIHHVNEQYDRGEIIEEFDCPVAPSDTPETLHEKVQHLAHRHYPAVIAQIIRQHHERR